MKKFIEIKSFTISLAICISVGYLASVITDIPFITGTIITIATVLLNGLIIMINEK